MLSSSSSWFSISWGSLSQEHAFFPKSGSPSNPVLSPRGGVRGRYPKSSTPPRRALLPGTVPSSVRGFLSDLDRLNHEVDRNLRDIRPFGTALHKFLRGRGFLERLD